MILYINSAYPATDASCAKVFDALKRSVGLRIDDILAAPKGKLTEIMKLGGIFPEQRAVRLKEIAALVKHTFAGDLRTVLKRPLPQARKALKQFPTIGDPVRTRFYCSRRRHQSRRSHQIACTYCLG